MERKTGLLRGSGLAWVLVTASVLGWVSAAHAVERQFLGIRMLSRVQTVLARFGNPTQVTVGQVAYNLPAQQQAGMAGVPGAPGRVGMAGVPGMPGVPGAPAFAGGGPVPGMPMPGYGGMPPMAGAGTAIGGGAMMGPRGSFGGRLDEEEGMAMVGSPMMGAPTTGTPGLPGLPGGIGVPRPGMGAVPGAPPMYGAPGMAGMTGTPGGVGLPSVGLRTTPGGMMLEQETTLIYERPGGVIYEFLVNKDGLVVQAKAIGYEDKSGIARTARGIKLGDTYQRVVAVYGWPKEHQNLGATLYVSYPNHHVAFQFYDNKVVSIIVAAMEK
ncbi:MAG: hypothetical protein NZ520_01740 [bacterium]|nr:hypothetical protein [bacterium]MCS7309962.1 hypothetical protein [Armatimonadota bacterium]MDW8105032.1 hypothetical protein [Armatimonadota bacterium]